MSGVDHTSLSVADFANAKAFYVAALKPLGITVLMEFPKAVTGNVDVAGLGSNGKPFFWIAAHIGGLSPGKALRTISLGSLLVALVALVVLAAIRQFF